MERKKKKYEKGSVRTGVNAWEKIIKTMQRPAQEMSKKGKPAGEEKSKTSAEWQSVSPRSTEKT